MYLYGASGHAKVIIDIIKTQGGVVEGLVDDNPNLKELNGTPVLHDATGLSPFIISIGNCKIRKMIAERLDCAFTTIIHSTAIISSTAIIGEGTVVMQGAIVQTEVKIGKHCIINTKASIDHECVIGDYVHIAPGCTISGDVCVGEGTWVGVGSSVIQGVRFGNNCFIGAGCVIVKDIPDNSRAYGVPCKIVGTTK